MIPPLLARLALAALAVAAARGRPALRPAAAVQVALALLAAGAWAPPWVSAGRHVLWPGVLVAGAAWALWKDEGLGSGPRKRRPHPSPWTGCRAPCAPTNDADPVTASPTPTAPSRLAQAILLGYLLAAVAVAATYAPGRGVPAALAARLAAVAVLVALLLRRRPSTWAQLAAVAPAIGLAIGVVAGAWPLVQAGGEAVRAGWGLARLETWITMGATAGAIGLAWRAERVR